MHKLKVFVLMLAIVLTSVFSLSYDSMDANAAARKKKTTQSKSSSKKAKSKTKSKKKTAKKSKKKTKKTSKKKAKKSRKSAKAASKKKHSKKKTANKSKRRIAGRNKVYCRGSGRALGVGNVMKIISYAKKYLGVNYRFGRSSSKAFDCSGFTMFIFRAAGIHLPHSAAGQANLGLSVEKSKLKPGDLVFFETYKPGISHVGMYIGNGHFIHASSGKGEVTITRLADAYYVKRYRGSTRIITN